MSRSATLISAMLYSLPTPIPGAPTLPQAFLVLVQAAFGVLCKGRGHHPGNVSEDGTWKRRYSSTVFHSR